LANLNQEFDTLLSKGDVERLGALIDKYLVDDFTCLNIDGFLITSKAEERANFIVWPRAGRV
jgi:hypothetical protein